MMKDMGATLDWYLEYSVKHDCNVMRTSLGPFFNTVELLHPDVARVGLGSGLHAHTAW